MSDHWTIETGLAPADTIAALAADVALRLAGAADADIDAVVVDALAQLATSAGAERGYVTMYRDDGTFDNSHEWTEPWIIPHAPAIRGLPTSQFPYSHGLAERGEPFDVRDLSDLPPEAEAERQSFGAFGVRSVLQIPIHVGGELLGMIGFNHYGEPSQWDAATIERLRRVGQAVGVALGRRAAERRTQRALAAAERANQVKDELITTASHELRSPLHAVLGFAEILALNGVSHPALDQIQDNGRILLRMIDDLLALGRVTELETDDGNAPMAAWSIVSEVVANLQHVADEIGSHLSAERPDRESAMVAEPLRLRQALHCLASSALVAAGQGGAVTAGEVPGDLADWAVTRIRLTASGPEHQPPAGGLGFALAQSFIEALGGHLEVDTDEEQTQIVVSLDRSRARTPRPEPS
jgi:signal transduction histidine kinase